MFLKGQPVWKRCANSDFLATRGLQQDRITLSGDKAQRGVLCNPDWLVQTPGNYKSKEVIKISLLLNRNCKFLLFLFFAWTASSVVCNKIRKVFAQKILCFLRFSLQALPLSLLFMPSISVKQNDFPCNAPVDLNNSYVGWEIEKVFLFRLHAFP